MEFVISLVSCAIGLIFGLIIRQLTKPESVGSLRINRSDPDGPYLFVEFENSDWYDKISKRSEVLLQVKFDD